MNTPSAPARIDAPSALPLGTRLAEFELREVLGVGGFGIVYLAFDHALEREVAVKDYMPASLAGRTETMHVSVRSQSDAETFALGLKSFVNEARLLAKFDHPSLLKVLRFWEGNGTAYMAMPVMRGRTLKDVRNEVDEPPSEDWLRALLDPLLGAIEKLHSEGVFHRDIAPDNIQIEPDGHPVLLDFGAARRVLSDKSQTLTAILKPAYAPIEQYAEVGAVKQGPWTDLYALGATLHYVLLKRPPAPATTRTVHDEASVLTTDRLPGCSENFLRTLDWMMAPRPMDRPQSVAALRDVLDRRCAPPWPPKPSVPVTPFVPGASEDQTVVLPRSGHPGPNSAPHDDPDATRVVTQSGPMVGQTLGGQTHGSTSAPGFFARTQGLMSPPVPTARDPEPATVPTRSIPAMPGPRPPTSTAPSSSPQPRMSAPTNSAQPTPTQSHAVPAAHAKQARSRKPLWLGAAGAVLLLGATVIFWPSAGKPPVAAPSAALPAATVTTGGVGVGSPLASSTSSTVPTGQAPAALPPTQTPAVPVETPVSIAAPAPVPVETNAAAAPAAAPRPVPPVPGRTGIPGAGNSSTHSQTSQAANAGAGKPAVRPGAGQTYGGNAPYGQTAETSSAAGSGFSGSGAYPAQVAPAAPAYGSAATPTAPPPPAGPSTSYPAPSNAQGPAATPAPSPEGKCGARNALRYFVCMERECLRSEFSAHPDCQQWRKSAKPE